ncbi:MAG TPA: hypothetical protein VFD32_05305 [Dehalococcoidia bacterium]|nr:hypothetical protein [Dehalococcoidia bacterium]
MAAVIGNLAASDDYLHPLGPEPNFNESMYFNFFDREQRIGGFVRLGNRANEGYAEMTVCLFLPDGRVLFQYKRPPIQHNDAFDAGGMRFEVIEPAERLRTRYDGSVVELKDPLEMAEPSAAFHSNPRKQVQLDLVHEAAGPMYGSAGHAEAEPAEPEKQFASAHYEQHMRATGTLRIEDETFQIDGLGLRDHSWGPRYWQAIDSYRWLTCNFGPDFGLMGSIVWQDKAKGLVRQGGVVVRDGGLTNVSAIAIDTRYAENGLYHEGFTARLTLEGGETLELEGTVRSFIPLRNRREGMITHVGEGMTEYRCGARVGYGLSEYLDQVR